MPHCESDDGAQTSAYLRGYSLSQVAQLLQSPRPHEVGLLTLHNAFDALVESARSLASEQEEINVFTLHRVNSFTPGRPFKRPPLTKLVDGTYRKYKATWRKLLSYQQQAIATLPATITAALRPSRWAPATAAISPYSIRRRRDLGQGTVDSSPGLQRSSPTLPLSPVRLRSQRHPRPPAGPQLWSSDNDSDSEYNAPLSPPQPPSSPQQAIRLRPPPTPPQLSTLQRSSPGPAGSAEPLRLFQPVESTLEEQTASLQLSLALLDQRIGGRLTNSIMVGFLAANGINREQTGFDEAVVATSSLSALVKMAQLLVLQHAVHEHREGRTDSPNDLVPGILVRWTADSASDGESSKLSKLSAIALTAAVRDPA
ncbi:hypothetical protein PSPO01_15651 [Paraphaeosphaeria sporulosa]